MSQQPRFNKTRMASVVRLAIYGLPMLACAQLTHAAQTESVTLDSMEVVEKRESYKVERTKVATKTDTPLRNIPQSISVVTDEQIRDQNMQSMADVVRYVPGVQMAQGEGHRDAPILRGNTSTADFFVDGMRDDTQYYRDLYNSERIEILKGPSGMIFGRDQAGQLAGSQRDRPELRFVGQASHHHRPEPGRERERRGAPDGDVRRLQQLP